MSNDSNASDETSIHGEGRNRMAVPIFMRVTPPKLTVWSHEKIVWFIKEWTKYLDTVESQGDDNVPISLKHCIERKLLEAKCTYEWSVDIDVVGDAKILLELTNEAAEAKNEDWTLFNQVFKSKLRMDMGETDVKARCLQYFMMFDSIAGDYGFTKVFNDNPKLKCDKLLENLYPPTLKEWVAIEISRDDTIKRNPPKLFETIKRMALKYEPTRLIESKYKKRGPDSKDKDEQPKNKKRFHAPKSNEPFQKPVNKQEQVQREQYVTKKKQERDQATIEWKKNRGSVPPSGCLKCKQPHWIDECPTATDEDKRRLLSKIAAGKKTQRMKKIVIARIHDCLDRHQRVVTLNGVLTIAANADSGADDVIIAKGHVEKLMRLDQNVVIKSLNPAIKTATWGNGKTYLCNEYVELKVTIHTAAGQVNLMKPVKCIVIDEVDGEFLIRNTLLINLGIDVNRMLDQLAVKADDMLNDDGLPSDEEDAVTIRSMAMMKHEVNVAIDQLINQATANGFPTDKINNLRKIVSKHDIWRIDLIDDPPAKVEAMQIQLKPGAMPFVCKARKYTSGDSEYMKLFNEKLVKNKLVFKNPQARWASAVLPVKNR